MKSFDVIEEQKKNKMKSVIAAKNDVDKVLSHYGVSFESLAAVYYKKEHSVLDVDRTGVCYR
jgi:hypothetical protein